MPGQLKAANLLIAGAATRRGREPEAPNARSSLLAQAGSLTQNNERVAAVLTRVGDAVGVCPTLRDVPCVRIDGSELTDWDSFHDVFAKALGFPAFYGRNMNAWIDCMTSLDAPEDGMTTIHGDAADPVVLHIAHASSIPPDAFDGLNECAAFVNWRRVEDGEPAILALSFWRTEPRATSSSA